VELDRQSIERRDFPFARRGYDPAAVDAHLRALAERAQELVQRAAAAPEPSLGTAAAMRVQAILEAAQATAAEIEREAQREAQRIRDEASREVERARTHLETLARASAALLASVESLDGEVSALAGSLRAGGEALSAPEEQSAVLAELQSVAPASVAEGVPTPSAPAPAPDASTALAPPSAPELVPAFVPKPMPLPESVPLSASEPAPASVPEPTPASAAEPVSPPTPESVPQADPNEQGGEDLDGARLVALNMALGGEPRELADRRLAESFQLADRAKLLDEVYAAVEG
jgi:DivIVA domain-containing protein